MHFFEKILNMDRVERIEWYKEMEAPGFVRDNISQAKLYFVSGDERLLSREYARRLFDYLDEQGQASSPETK